MESPPISPCCPGVSAGPRGPGGPATPLELLASESPFVPAIYKYSTDALFILVFINHIGFVQSTAIEKSDSIHHCFAV